MFRESFYFFLYAKYAAEGPPLSSRDRVLGLFWVNLQSHAKSFWTELQLNKKHNASVNNTNDLLMETSA